MIRRLAWIAVVVALLVAGTWGWYTLRQYQTRTDWLERKVAQTEGELREKAVDAERLREAEAEARRLAQTAEAAAQRQLELRSEAESARQDAEAARESEEQRREEAEAAARDAAESASKARRELETVIAARQAELDRMHDALSRIVDTERTERGMVVVLTDSNFTFGFDQATLTAENRELLSRIAGVLLASSGYRLSVDGHTDDQGPEAYNQTLSEKRARNVATYLYGAGIPQDLVEVNGYGESNPKVAGTSADARAKNRRVEIGITDTVITYHGIAANQEAATP